MCKVEGNSLLTKPHIHTIGGVKVTFSFPFASFKWDFLLLVTPKDSQEKKIPKAIRK